MTPLTTYAEASIAHALEHVDRKNVRGAIVDCAHGGNIMVARAMSPHRTCWLYDTFEQVTREAVIANLRAHDVWDVNRIRIVPGMVEDTLTDPRNVPKSIAVMELEPASVALKVLYPRLMPNGVLIIGGRMLIKPAQA